MLLSRDMPIGTEKEFKVRYMGGHKAFPDKTHTKLRIDENGVELVNPSLRIPYSSMNRIENMEKKNFCIASGRVRYNRGVMEKEIHVYNNSIWKRN
jgi:hypothetical protein